MMFSRTLTFNLDDYISILQHLEQNSCPHSQFGQLLFENTCILHQNINKHKLKIIEALYIGELNKKEK